MPFVRVPGKVGPFKKWANKAVDASDLRPESAGAASARKFRRKRRKRRKKRKSHANS